MAETGDVKADAREALGRSAIYRLVAVALSYPAPEVLGFLRDGFTRKLGDAVSLLPGDGQPELAGAVEELNGIVSGLGEIEGEYNRLFRTALVCTPYETEYDPMRSVRKGHVLADILGFYTAFGLRPSGEQRELPDHLGAELEFMSLLLQKEAYARLNDWSDKIEVCTDAQRKFLSDHLGTWIFAFCNRLEETAGLAFYRSLGRLLRKFMEQEMKGLGIEPLKIEGCPILPDHEAFTCPVWEAGER